jgi:hypothetical protein
MTGERAEVLSSRGAVCAPHVRSPYKSFGRERSVRYRKMCTLFKRRHSVEKLIVTDRDG